MASAADGERDAETQTQVASSPHQAIADDDYSALAPSQTRDPHRYRVLAEHGRGGLGRVLRAHDRELKRTVAIKETLGRSREDEIRFFREALITAQLEHPGIVPVHEAGRWPDGTPFYSMKLVAGRPMSERIATASSLDERLSLLPNVLAVADAISYAHARGIIHRDLKPSNIMVGDYGETVVVDWGLARPVDQVFEAGAPDSLGAGDPWLTATGAVLGTPAYMPPEQASGARVDHRADVYALGAILFHLLHGHPPGISGRTDDRAPVELQAIARKALAASPDERYGSATGFAVDLRRYVRGGLVEAHTYRRRDRLLRWARRHTGALAVALVATVALLTLLTVAATRIVWARNAATRQGELAEQRAIALAVEKARAEKRATDLVVAHATRLVSDDPAAAAALLADNATSIVHRDDVSTLLRDVVHAGLPDWILRISAPSVIALSADATRLAIHDASGLTIVDVATRAPVRQWSTPLWPGMYRDLHWADEHHVVAKAVDGAVHVYDIDDATEKSITPWCGEAPFSAFAGTVAAICDDGHLYVSEVEGAGKRYAVAGATAVAVADASTVIVGDARGRLAIIRPSHTRLVAIDATPVTVVEVSPTRDRVLVGTRGGHLAIVDLSRARAKRIPNWSSGAVYEVAWADEALAVIAAGDRRISIVDVRTGHRSLEAAGTKFRVTGDYVAIEENGRIQLVAKRAPWSARLAAHGAEASWMTTARGALATACDSDATVRFWRRLPLPTSFIQYDGVAAEIAESRALDGIVYLSSEGQASVCTTKRCAPLLSTAPGGTYRFSEDGGLVAVVSDNPARLIIRDLVGGRERTYELEATAADVAPSREVVAVGYDTTIVLANASGIRMTVAAPKGCDRVFGLHWQATDALLVRCRRTLYRFAPSSGYWLPVSWPPDEVLHSAAPLANGSLVISTMTGAIWVLPDGVSTPFLVTMCLRDASPLFRAGDDVSFTCDGNVMRLSDDGHIATLDSSFAGSILFVSRADSADAIAVSSVDSGLMWNSERHIVSIVPFDEGVDRMAGNSTQVYVASRPGLIEVWDRSSLRDLPTDSAAWPLWLLRATEALHAALPPRVAKSLSGKD